MPRVFQRNRGQHVNNTSRTTILRRDYPRSEASPPRQRGPQPNPMRSATRTQDAQRLHETNTASTTTTPPSPTSAKVASYQSRLDHISDNTNFNNPDDWDSAQEHLLLLQKEIRTDLDATRKKRITYRKIIRGLTSTDKAVSAQLVQLKTQKVSRLCEQARYFNRNHNTLSRHELLDARQEASELQPRLQAALADPELGAEQRERLNIENSALIAAINSIADQIASTGLSNEMLRFEGELVKLEDELSMTSNMQPRRKHLKNLSATRIDMDNRLRETLAPGAPNELVTAFQKRLDRAAQKINAIDINTLIAKTIKQRQEFCQTQQAARNATALARIAEQYLEKLTSHAKTLDNFTRKPLTQNTARQIRKTGNTADQEIKLLTLYLAAEDFHDRLLELKRLPLSENTLSEKTLLVEYDAIISAWEALNKPSEDGSTSITVYGDDAKVKNDLAKYISKIQTTITSAKTEQTIINSQRARDDATLQMLIVMQGNIHATQYLIANRLATAKTTKQQLTDITEPLSQTTDTKRKKEVTQLSSEIEHLKVFLEIAKLKSLFIKTNASNMPSREQLSTISALKAYTTVDASSTTDPLKENSYFQKLHEGYREHLVKIGSLISLSAGRHLVKQLKENAQHFRDQIRQLNDQQIPSTIQARGKEIQQNIAYLGSLLSLLPEKSVSKGELQKFYVALQAQSQQMQLFSDIDGFVTACRNGSSLEQQLKECGNIDARIEAAADASSRPSGQMWPTPQRLTRFYRERFNTAAFNLHYRMANRIFRNQETAHQALYELLPETAWLSRLQARRDDIHNAQISIKQLLETKFLSGTLRQTLATTINKLELETIEIELLGEIQSLEARLTETPFTDETIATARRDAEAFHDSLETLLQSISQDTSVTSTPLLDYCKKTLSSIDSTLNSQEARLAIRAASTVRRSNPIDSLPRQEHQRAIDSLTAHILRLERVSQENLLPALRNSVDSEIGKCKTLRRQFSHSLIVGSIFISIRDIRLRFKPLGLSANERNHLKSYLETERDQLTHYPEYVHFDRNLSASLNALASQLITINALAHLNRSEKNHLAQWCSRLMQHGPALRAKTTKPVIEFANMLQQTLQNMDANPVLAKDLVATVRDAACTDWGSKILLDMQAITLSHYLVGALENHLQSTPHTTAEKRLNHLEKFISDNRRAFVALLNYSAFQTAANTTSIIDSHNAESIEIYLLLYVTAKRDFLLPGKIDIDRMAYSDYTINNIVRGEDVFNQKQQAVNTILQGAQGHLKSTYLNQLSGAFNIKIWDKIIEALPNQATREADTQNLRNSILEEMAELEEAQSQGHITDQQYALQLEALNKRYLSLEHHSNADQEQYTQRLMAKISSNT